MECAFCSSKDTKVLESRSTEDNTSIRRRRECGACEKRFTTYERIEFTAMIVSKSSGSKEVYSREKLISSIVRSCSKSKISAVMIDSIVDQVEAEMYSTNRREISASLLGKLVMDALKERDALAYLRYASIFKKFSSVTEFIEEIKSLEDKLLGIEFEEIKDKIFSKA